MPVRSCVRRTHRGRFRSGVPAATKSCRRGAVALAFGLCLASATRLAAANDPGLVLHYTFEQAEDGRVVDQSGLANHGRIHGARPVHTERGAALRFDGEDDFVDCGRDGSLQIEGDMSLEFVLRARPENASGRNRLLFGDASSLGVKRNYNLRVDQGRLLFEWADGRINANHGSPAPFLDGRWRHVAYVIESPNAHYLYVDGEPVTVSRRVRPISLTGGGPRQLGGWFAGAFKGEMAEVRVYRRALSESEVAAHAAASLTTGTDPASGSADVEEGDGSGLELRIEPTHVRASDEVRLDLFLRSDRASSWVARIAVAPLNGEGDGSGSQAVVVDQTALGDPTRPGSGRWLVRRMLPAPGLVPGPYRVEVELLEGVGSKTPGSTGASATPEPDLTPRTVVSRASSLMQVVERPAWLGSDAGREAGLEQEVLAPYSPVVAKRGSRSIEVQTANHTYRFDDASLLSEASAGGRPLLASPVRLHARIDGRDRPADFAAPQRIENTPRRATIRQRTRAGPLLIRSNVRVAVDGFLDIRLEVRADDAPDAEPANDADADAPPGLSLDQLRVVLPLRPEHARYVNTWPATHSGAFEQDLAWSFRPIVNLLGDDAGLAWMAESDRDWSPHGASGAIEIRRRDGATELRLNLISEPRRLAPGQTLRYRFGLQGLPVKPPHAPDAWDYRVVRIEKYGHEFDWPNRRVGDMNAIEYHVKGGARAALVLRPWTVFAYPLPIGHEQKFRELMQACDEAGLAALPYIGGFLISEKAPEFDAFKNDFRKLPPRPFPIIDQRVPGLGGQMCYHACPKGAWQDFIVHGAARLIDEFHADGVYLDSPTMPQPCANQAHGCGYVNADGALVPTYPVFATRRMIQRLYHVVKTRKPEGHVDVHPYDGLMTPALAFATVTWIGEHVHPPNPEHVLDVLPLDRFRTEFMDHNLGLSTDLLYYRLGDYAAAAGLAFLHDVPTRSERDHTFKLQSAIWRLREAVGGDDARWSPYWKPNDRIRVAPADVKASVYHHPERGRLIVVFNTRREPVAATVRIRDDQADPTPERSVLLHQPRPGGAGMTARELATDDAEPGVYTIPLDVEGWAALRITP